MRSLLGLAASLTALAIVVGDAAGISAQRASTRPATSLREAIVPFKVGETLTYDVSWSSILVAGTAVVSVKEKTPSANSTAYSIVAEGQPVPLVARLYSLHYRMDTLLDTYTLLPHRSSLYAQEGSDRRTATTKFDRPTRRVFFEEQSGTTTKLDYPVPNEAQDGLSTLYAIRSKPFKAGDRLTLPVADSGTLYNIEVVVGAPESIKVPFGAASAWALKGTIKDLTGQPVWNNVGVWISNDARRLPMKLQGDLPIGNVVLALHDVK